MCSSQASGNKLWDHFSFMAPLLMERNSTQTTFQHLPAGIQEFVKMDFFGSEGFHGGCDCWGYGVWGEGEERFVDQLTRIFERQLFFRNLYQSFQQRYKKAAHLQNIWHDFSEDSLILRQNQKITKLNNVHTRVVADQSWVMWLWFKDFDHSSEAERHAS